MASTTEDREVANRSRPESIPAATSLLRWVYVGRVSVATVVFVAAAFYFSAVSPGVMVTVAVAALLSLTVTAVSAFYTHVREVPPSPAFLYAQAMFDLALVTTVIHVTGGVSSDFTSLYILVIAVSAMTMPFRGTLLVTLAASTAYFAEGIWGRPSQLSVAVVLQIAVFIAVALGTGWLSSRERVVRAQQRKLEQEVKRLRLEASDILREISGGIITVDEEGLLVYANASAERLLGFVAEDFEGQPFMEYLKLRSHVLWMAIVGTQKDGAQQIRAEGTITADDRSFPVGVTTTPHTIEKGSKPSVTAIFTDISDQKRLNELNVRTERLEAVAALSASLAHEIKNPLASIRSSVEQLSRSVRADEDDEFLAELILRETDRLSRLLSEFLDFTRVRMTEAHTVEIRSIARTAVDLIREHPDCPKDAVIQIVGKPTRVEGDEDLLHRIVVNLVLNALQASGGKAKVTITVREVRPRELPSGVPSDRSVMLRVSDDGPGIPEHLRRSLFDPFVTGREGGTGLGLAIVQRAVQVHRGFVFVDSEAGVGTTFSIYLPSPRAREVAA